ncbi:YeeE/YedE thiosulfate transporter family protein [Sphingorhabdus sp. Alg239-R122]|uniref:YeeE/YedE thiosulfate transporter family protein n=1 Tax=Sphingorhabdus sp. Alg239-R122 TaxID=2305989 RepID=UPI0013D96BF9|nr:YeeE/YedE thiosulfate transporter family protein [Sphingorhabdus sp. Alg239-R122]
MTSFAIIPLAFILGFALARAATCTVAATGRLVIAGKWDWMFGLLVVPGWAGLTLFALVQTTDGTANLPVDLVMGWQMVVAAILMGIGAFLNRACFVGTVSKIGTGDFAYLLTFAGLALAMWIGHGMAFMDNVTVTQANAPILQDSGRIAAYLVFAVLAAISLYRMVKDRNRAMMALCTVGISAALIFGSSDNWGYTQVMDNLVNGAGLSSGMALELSIFALFGGAIVSSALRDRFRPHFSNMRLASMNFIGGFLMGVGALAVPGGNDLLLLWTIPGLAIYGVAAYLVMIATIAAIMWTMRRRGSHA